ncbi:MAG: aminoglycoside phosphotransferase family protein [Lactobacillus sp.]|jgi:hypothetical protein|nr:aminoglycoside phosphotransferase family protein [Lactobacillus sp.]
MIDKILTYLKLKKIPQLLGLKSTVQVTFLAQGEYNQNFLLSDGQNPQQFVLRFNYGSQLPIDNQIRYEYQALQWLERSQVTPKVYYLDDGQDYFDQGLLIEAFLPGRPLDYHQDLGIAAGIFGRIHRLTIDGQAQQQFLKETQDILVARIQECTTLLTPVFASQVIAQPVKQLLANALDNCRQHEDQQRFFTDLDLWAVNNTEVNSHNFIIGRQGWLIDWEKPVISHPVQDISQFLASTTTLWRSDVRLTSAQKQGFLDQYLATTGFDRADFLAALAIYHPYLMLRALSWSAMAYDSYLSDTKALKNEAIFQKVKSYLNPNFLAPALQEQVFAHD